VWCNEEPECLLKVKLSDLLGSGNGLLRKGDLSFGRITNEPAHQGWQYLKVFVERIMVSQGPFLVVARLKSKGSRKAFENFEQGIRGCASTYNVLVAGIPSSSATGYVSNHHATLESIRSIVTP
jgi:hypothetical protein